MFSCLNASLKSLDFIYKATCAKLLIIHLFFLGLRKKKGSFSQHFSWEEDKNCSAHWMDF